MSEYIQDRLFALQDLGYRDFHSKLLPTVSKELIIGIRVPQLRKLARELKGSLYEEQHLAALPHEYYDEDMLHVLFICQIKDFDSCLEAVESFLPYVDNWAVCDGLNPKALGKNKPELLKRIPRWLCSEHSYTVRFAMGMLMNWFLDGDFKREYLSWVAAVKTEEYYVRMMQAWYFATALAKQYDEAVKYIRAKTLEPWTHNKAIQKARESYRISDEQKEYLNTLKIQS